MKRHESATRTKFWQRIWLPVLVSTIILIMTLWLWQGLLLQQQVHMQANVELAGKTVSKEITTGIQTRILALRRMAERWEVVNGTTYKDWVADATNYSKDYPGFKALEWVDESYHVRWVVPRAGNELAENIDAARGQNRWYALQTALKSRKPTITSTVNLAQGGKGFLVYVPLYINESKFNGFIVGVFDTHSLIDGILDQNLKQQYALAIFDDGEEIYTTEHSYRHTTNSTAIDIEDVIWQMRISPKLAAIAQQHSSLANLVLIAGSVMAVLVGWVVCLIQRTRSYATEVEFTNQELSHEISDRQRVEAQLMLSENRFRSAFEHTAVGMALLSTEGNWSQVNSAFCQMIGYSEEELLNTSFVAITHPDDLETDLSYLRKFLENEINSCTFEKRYIHKLGYPVWILLSVSTVYNDVNQLLYFVAQIQDITASKHAEAELRWQETLLRSMANSSPLAFYVVDERTSEILYLNHRFCEIWGIECWEEQMQQGKVKLDCIQFSGCCDCQPNSQSIPKSVTEACQGLLPIEENRIVQEDEIPYVNGRIIRRFSTQIRDHEDRYFGRLYIFEDVTERKSAEAAMRNLGSALESTVEGICQLDIKGRYIYVNSAYACMIGYQAEEMIGMAWQNHIYPDDRQKVTDAHEKMLTNGKVDLEIMAMRRDGSMFEQQVVMVKACDQQQNLIGNYCFMNDISDRREVERLKDEFVSVVSHELRTPLTSIRGSLGLVANGVLENQPQKAQRMLEIAVNNSDRLIRLINDILDIERIESGKVQMTKQMCDVANLMNQSVDIMRTLAEKAEVNLSVTPLSVRLYADPDRMIQTLTNLLSNAIKFSEPGSTVWLTAQLKNTAQSKVLFQVKDQGRGIPADKLETIFGRFQQVDASDSRKKGGTGLGLAICRSIVQHHDGEIWVESVLGKGSTFYVSVPLALQKELCDRPLVLQSKPGK